MSVTPSMVKDLREKTGAGMMDCKRALEETSGDFEKAIEYLRKKGIASAAKKAGRATREGSVSSVIQSGGKTGVMVEINCETDFVARTDQFKNFVRSVNEQITQSTPIGTGEGATILAQSFVKDASKKMEDVLKETISTLGENMSIRRYAHYQIANGANGVVASYIHGEGKVGVLVEVTTDKASVTESEAFQTFVKDLSMHIAAAAPSYVRPDEVPADIVAKEKEIALAQMQGQNKPAAVLEKIAEGKVGKFYEDACLIKQAFVKDPAKKIEALTAETAKAAGGTITIARFTRFVLGEGLASGEAVH